MLELAIRLRKTILTDTTSRLGSPMVLSAQFVFQSEFGTLRE